MTVVHCWLGCPLQPQIYALRAVGLESAGDGQASGGLRDLYLRGFIGEVEHLLRRVREGGSPGSSAEDNVKTMARCDELLRRSQ
ncbi:hypothetical protein [Nonomuraea jabiensis]|uniref:hypothetical protein n=1 Tax=Nonomuraea jabiensis TaxID=882448 RepID=UPI003D70CECC